VRPMHGDGSGPGGRRHCRGDNDRTRCILDRLQHHAFMGLAALEPSPQGNEASYGGAVYGSKYNYRVTFSRVTMR
jgi:hypothetical protein